MTEQQKAIFIAILESIEFQSEKIQSGISYRTEHSLDWNNIYLRDLEILVNALQRMTQ